MFLHESWALSASQVSLSIFIPLHRAGVSLPFELQHANLLTPISSRAGLDCCQQREDAIFLCGELCGSAGRQAQVPQGLRGGKRWERTEHLRGDWSRAGVEKHVCSPDAIGLGLQTGSCLVKSVLFTLLE